MERDQISMDAFGKPHDDRTVPGQEEEVSFRGTLKRTDEDCVEEQELSPYFFFVFPRKLSEQSNLTGTSLGQPAHPPRLVQEGGRIALGAEGQVKGEGGGAALLR